MTPTRHVIVVGRRKARSRVEYTRIAPFAFIVTLIIIHRFIFHLPPPSDAPGLVCIENQRREEFDHLYK